MTAFLILHQHVLGDFQLDPLGRDIGRVDGLRHSGDQVGVLHLRRREIDGDTQIAGHDRDIGERLADDPLAQRCYKTRFLGHMEEIARSENAALRMVPAQQGLEPRRLAGIEVDDRLILHVHLALAQSIRQIAFDTASLAGGDVERRFEQRQLVPALFLRRIERKVGTAHDFFRIAIALGAAGNTDAGRDAVRMPFDFIGRANDREEPVGAFDEQAIASAGFDEDRELVAPQPRDEVFTANFLFEPRAHLAQEPVAHQMAARIVDRLEIIEVEIEQRYVRPFRRLPSGQAAQTLVEEVPVRKAGEIVVMRHEGDALFDQAVRGHIAGYAAHPAILARAGRQTPETLLPADAHADQHVTKRAALDHAACQLFRFFAIAEEPGDGSAFELRRIAACCLREAIGHVSQIAVRPHSPEPVR